MNECVHRRIPPTSWNLLSQRTQWHQLHTPPPPRAAQRPGPDGVEAEVAVQRVAKLPHPVLSSLLLQGRVGPTARGGLEHPPTTLIAPLPPTLVTPIPDLGGSPFEEEKKNTSPSW